MDFCRRNRIWCLRPHLHAKIFLKLLPVICAIGCTWLDLGKVGPKEIVGAGEERKPTHLVGDLAVPFGLHPVTVEGVGLVTGLRGTGGDPRPSGMRQSLLAEMRARGIADPEAVLASPNTALVVVRGVLPPGIQRGDRFDIEVRIPSQDDTTSLRGGWLLDTELKEFALVSDNSLRTGHTMGKASGPIMVDPFAQAKNDAVLKARGWILGGGTSKISRPLALVLRPEHQSVLNSARIEAAVNRRFHVYDRGRKLGVAKAKTDEYVEIRIHPRYTNNVSRYAQVLCAISLRDMEQLRQERLSLLEKQLLDPSIAASAALQLEAMGRDALPVLRKGLQASDLQVRFYAAEALAYLDQTEAVQPLAEIARDVPAFRAFALAALSAMDDAVAAAELRSLLDSPSAETRYGAFRALTAMEYKDPVVQGEHLNGQFYFHVLEAQGPPMVHLTRSRRPEVVLFGRNQRLKAPLATEAGNEIMVVSRRPGEVVISRFAVNEPDQKRVVSDRLEEVIRAIAELGGTYPDVVQALQEAQAQGSLEGRLEIDALPKAGRALNLAADSPSSHQGEMGLSHPEGTGRPDSSVHPAATQAPPRSPVPGLFPDLPSPDHGEPPTAGYSPEEPWEAPARARRGPLGWLGKLKSDQ